MYMEKKILWKAFDGTELATPEQVIKYTENELQLYFDQLLLEAVEKAGVEIHFSALHALRIAFVDAIAGDINKAEKFHKDFSFMIYGDGKHLDEHIQDEEKEE